MDETSLSLLARVRQPTDSDAWERLADLYVPLIRGWLRAYGLQDADSEDLIQEVLAVVAREVAQFDHNQRPGAFRSWLRTMVVHRLRHFWRTNSNRHVAAGGTSVLEQLNQLEDETSEQSRIWNQQHDREVISRLVEIVKPTFQPGTWEAFHRQMFGGQSAQQVAAELKMPLGSVYMARHRVLHALRREAMGLVDPM